MYDLRGECSDALGFGIDADPWRILLAAHAALPDGDPRKLTRADVGLLLDYATFFRREGMAHPRLGELDALAAKLAALLPPETPDAG